MNNALLIFLLIFTLYIGITLFINYGGNTFSLFKEGFTSAVFSHSTKTITAQLVTADNNYSIVVTVGSTSFTFVPKIAITSINQLTTTVFYISSANNPEWDNSTAVIVLKDNQYNINITLASGRVITLESNVTSLTELTSTTSASINYPDTPSVTQPQPQPQQTYDNYNHYSDSSTSVFYYGNDGSKATIMNNNGKYTIIVTSSTGQTTYYILTNTSLPQQYTIANILQQFAGQTFAGSNGGTATIIMYNGQFAISITDASGITIIYTSTVQNTSPISTTNPPYYIPPPPSAQQQLQLPYGASQYYSTLPAGTPASNINPVNMSDYILKSQIIPMGPFNQPCPICGTQQSQSQPPCQCSTACKECGSTSTANSNNCNVCGTTSESSSSSQSSALPDQTSYMPIMSSMTGSTGITGLYDNEEATPVGVLNNFSSFGK